MKPFLYQTEAMTALAGARQERKERALVVMASGLGKTVLAALDAQAYLADGGRLLYLCHQNEILKQARRTFEAVLGSEYTYANLYGNSKDLRRVHTAKCVFSSFQTMREWYEIFPKGSFDYIIVDEGHHVQAMTYRSTLEYFRADFVVGLTATPDRSDLQDIRTIYGEEVYSLPLELALARRLLTPVHYILRSPKLENWEGLVETAASLKMSELDELLFKQPELEEVVADIQQSAQEIEDPRVMVFCSSIADCDMLESMIPQGMAIHSKLSTGVQDERLAALRSGELPMVFTVDKFNEGLDVPEVNMVAFLRSTTSRTIFLQQLGRGLRRAEGKDSFLALDFVGSYERLQMVRKLWRAVAEASEQYRDEATEDTIQLPKETIGLSVSVGKVEFDQATHDILDLIEKSREKRKQLREAARSSQTECQLTPDEMLEGLRTMAKELDRRPLKYLLRGMGLPAARFYIKEFGSWSKALEAAGFVPGDKHYSDEELVDFIVRYATELGRVPSPVDIALEIRRGKLPNQLRAPHGAHYVESAVDKLPEEISGAKDHENFRLQRREYLIQFLNDLARRIGQMPSKAHVGGRGLPTAEEFELEFGSWPLALKAAGFVPRGVRCTDEELIEQLHDLRVRLGHPLKHGDIVQARRMGQVSGQLTSQVPRYRHLIKRFNQEYKSTELPKQKPVETTPDEETGDVRTRLLAKLKALIIDTKEFPSGKSIERARRDGADLPSVPEIKEVFGTMDAACLEAWAEVQAEINATQGSV